MTIFALLGAAGKGARMRSAQNKVLLMLKGKTVIQHSVQALSQSGVDRIIVLVNESDQEFLKSHMAAFSKVVSIIQGGKERQDSMYAGLREVKRLGGQPGDWVVFHDAARCLVTVAEIDRCIAAAKETGASVAGHPTKNTIKQVSPDGFVIKTIPRDELFVIQSPQVIELGLASEAFDRAFKEGFYGTDDVSLVERLGRPVKVVVCSSENIKLTTPDDLVVAEAILQKRGES